MSILPHDAWQNFAQVAAQLAPAAASILVASVWRGLLLASLVALTLKLFPRLSAEVRSAIWLCVLAAVLVSPVLSLGAAYTQTPRASGVLHLDPRWSYALVSVWAMFSFLRLLQLAVSAWQLSWLARRSTPIAAEASVLRILRASRRHVALCTSLEVDRPSAVGFFRPRILLPSDLPAKLSASELEHIVLHELEHLRRRDDWTNLLQKLSLALLPLHPVVLWLDRRLCLERELACDDGVLRATQARKSYAACLTNLAEHSLLRRGLSLTLGVLGTWKPQSEVARRVCRILAAPKTAMSPLQSRAASAALLASVVAGSVALAHTPHLVSFAPETHMADSTISAPATEAALAAPSSPRVLTAHVSADTPHAVFAKATAAPRATNAALRLGRQQVAGKREQGRRFVQVSQPALAPQEATSFRLAAWQEDEFQAPHFALAIEQDSHFTYAAVPVRGGWIVFQL